jgi:ubiquitin-conjugating enzyme E2 D/E
MNEMESYVRVKKEVDDVIKYVNNSISYVSTSTVCIYKIKSPVNSIYGGKIYEIKFEYSPDYPFKAPKVSFLEDIYHPNVLLQEVFITELTDWSPAYTTIQILQSIIDMFSTPQKSNIMNAEAMSLFPDRYHSNE